MRQTGLVSLVLSATLVAGSVLACAEASDPLPAAEEVLLLVHRTTGSLSLIRISAPGAGTPIPLGGVTPSPTTVAALGGWAVVPLGDDPSVAVVNLRTARVERLVPLPANSGATGAAVVDDSIAYVGNPNLNTVTRVNYLTGDTASVAVGQTPRMVVFTRGKVFVINANLTPAGNPLGPSWVSVIDPETNRLATGVDSILLPGPGKATYADVAADGLLYVMNAGPSDGSTDSRLSLVDPVGRHELGNFNGFGNDAGAVADDGGTRLFVSSASQGLMVFDLIKRELLKGAGSGIPISENSGVAVDDNGRIYALESGSCTAGAAGRLHILRSNLTESRVMDVAECPVAALVTEVPPQ
jgi:hypothetical protein